MYTVHLTEREVEIILAALTVVIPEDATSAPGDSPSALSVLRHVQDECDSIEPDYDLVEAMQHA